MLNATTNANPTAETTTLPETRPMSGPRALLHLEALALTVAAILFYTDQGWGWGTFFLLFLAPDLAFLAYIVDQKLGIRVYNVVHWAALPLLLAGLGVLTGGSTMVQIATIWFVHIFLDRVVGYGFKYDTGANKDTHMQRA